MVEVNQQNSTILYPDQESTSNEPTRKRGRPRKSAQSGSTEPSGKPGIVNKEPWPFPRYSFSPEINERTISFDTARIGSPETQTEAVRSDVVLRTDSGTGGSGGGNSSSVQSGEKRRRRAPKRTAVLGEPGHSPVIQPSEATTVQAEPVKQSPTLARQTSEVKKPAVQVQSRPVSKSPIGLMIRGLNKVFGR